MTKASPAKPPHPEPDGDERPSGPSLGVTAGGLKIFAKGAVAVYGASLVAIGFGIFVRVIPVIVDFSSALDRSTRQLDRTTESLARSTEALAVVAADAHEAKAGVGRLEQRLDTLATRVELEDVRQEVRRVCGGRR